MSNEVAMFIGAAAGLTLAGLFTGVRLLLTLVPRVTRLERWVASAVPLSKALEDLGIEIPGKDADVDATEVEEAK